MEDNNSLTDENITSDKKIKKIILKKIFLSLFLIIAFISVLISSIIYASSKEDLPNFLKKSLETNEKIAQIYYSKNKLAPTFDKSLAEDIKPNGDIGMNEDFDIKNWKLNFINENNNESKIFSIEQIKSLPSFEMTTEFKCVEGWSKIVNWKGVKFSDFLDKNHINFDSDYVYLETPDKEYYVSIDKNSAMHPQTILAYEMNGKPLTLEHGAPLRLVTSLKYGIKQIKRIGTIKLMKNKPKDYWAEKGYDWYAGH
ncbi:MAG: molybdopterin-dependent oxidoreductase [Candidatus Sericytochromatia bacterium]